MGSRWDTGDWDDAGAMSEDAYLDYIDRRQAGRFDRMMRRAAEDRARAAEEATED